MSRLEALADALVREGARAVFGIPGSGASLQLITALERRGVRFHAAAHEAAAHVMAGAFSACGGGLGCALSIKGPGLANMLPAMLSSVYEQWPTLSIAEAYGVQRPPGRRHKWLDHAAATAPVTKAYARWGDGGDLLGDLLACAREEVPGPVHLDLIVDAPAAVERRAPLAPGGAKSLPEAVQTRLARAARPIVIVGALARRRAWAGQLASLRVPVFTTVAAKGVVDERRPCAAGVYTGEGQALAPERALLPQADLVLGLGLRNTEVLTPQALGPHAVLLDEIDGGASEGFQGALAHQVEAPVVATALETLAPKSWGLDLVAEAAARARERLCAAPWLPGRAFVLLEAACAGGPATLVVDTGFFCTVAEHVWRAPTPESFLGSANGRFMGLGLPMAIGASLAQPGRPVVCALGDGGMRAYPGELKRILAERLPVLVLLLTDGCYGSIAGVPAAQGLSRQATTVPEPSWVGAAKGLGFEAVQVTDAAAFERAVQAWDRRAPAFIEAVFDPRPYGVMLEGIR